MSDLLNIGITGLNSSKKSLQTTGHNIANANTEGYSRQKVNQTSNTPVIKQGHVMGTGSRVVSISRYHDELVEKRLNANISTEKYFDERSLQLTQMENIFNEIDQDGLNKMLNNFFNSFRELANQPENETIRSVVRDNANLVVKDFARIKGTLDDISRGTDKKIAASLEHINQLSDHIALLNTKIKTLEAAGSEASDLRDQRDRDVGALSEYFNVVTYSDEEGHYVVSAKNVGTLVAGSEVQRLASGTLSKENSSNNMDGAVEIYFENKPNFAVTSRFQGGTLSSLYKVRNTDLVRTRTEIDSLAYDLAKSVNAIHRRGFVNRQIELSESGEAPAFDNKGPTTGIDFFKEPLTRDNAAGELSLSDDVRADLTNIVTALSPNSPGDNRISLGISKLQHEKMLKDGTTTLEEQYLQTIANIGQESGKAQLDKEQSTSILAQTRSIKERLSGVSIDEETANMVRYQQAYDASAKVMKTADDMFKTVLNLKN